MKDPSIMNFRHFCLALSIALVWGANFPVMKIGLNGISPLIFSGLRSLLILPLLFFIPRPKISWKVLLLIGLLIGTLTVPLLLLAIHLGVAAGLSSLIIQAQAFFTVLLALLFFNQKPSFLNWMGMSIAFLGIGFIGIQVGGEASLLGLGIALISAIVFAISNLVLQQKGQTVDMFSLMAWMNIVPPIPLFLLSSLIYGNDQFFQSFQNFTWISGASLLYASLVSGLFGYTTWGFLLKKYPAAVVTPFSLLVPVFAISFAYLTVDETLTTTSIYGCLLVISGLIINQLKTGYLKFKNPPK